MSDVIPTQRVRVVADAVVSAYINEIAAPARPDPPATAPPAEEPAARPLFEFELAA